MSTRISCEVFISDKQLFTLDYKIKSDGTYSLFWYLTLPNAEKVNFTITNDRHGGEAIINSIVFEPKEIMKFTFVGPWISDEIKPVNKLFILQFPKRADFKRVKEIIAAVKENIAACKAENLVKT